MDLMEIIKHRRSIRRYEDKAIPEELIKQIIEAGRFAPSSHNSQPWRFIVITDKKVINKLSDAIKHWFKNKIRLGSFLSLFYKKLRHTIDAAEKRVFTDKDLFFYDAPCIILICSKQGRFHAQDCALAAQNMMLTAYSLGIGSCWIGFADVVLNRKKKLMKELGVPKKHKIMATLIFGYTEKYPSSPYPRKEEANIIKWIK